MLVSNKAQSIIYVDGEEYYLEQGTGTLSLYESMDMFFPYASYRGTDTIGLYQGHYPLVQSSDIKVTVMNGDDKIDYRFIPFSESSSLSNPIANSYLYNLDLIHPSSVDLFTKSEFQSKKCKASDYVSYIAGKVGLKSNVEESDMEKVWISPGWRYSQMLRYLSQHAKATSGSYGYKYFINRKNELVFKTIDKFFEEGGDGEDLEIYQNDDNLHQMVINRNITSPLFLSANFIKTNSYNLEQDNILTEEFDPDKMLKKYGKVRGLGEKYKNTGGNNYVELSFDSDRKTSVYHKKIYNKVSIAAETTSVQLTLAKNFSKRHVGDIINLKFRSNDNKEISLPHSGRYVIKDLITVLGKDTAQKLVLVRPGLNINREGVI